MTATYSMIIEYFTGKHLSWPELEAMSGFKDDKPAWSMQAYIAMYKMGIRVKMYDSFDYRAYLKRGLDYYKQFLTPQEYEWQIKHAALPDKKLIPEFLEVIDWKCKSANLHDIEELLKHDMIVTVGLNMRALNQQDGFVLHAVLILEESGVDFIVHDPGLPAVEYRKVSKALLYQAMGGDGHNQEVAGFSKL